MRRRRIESSAIESVGYDGDTAVLEIEFTSGEVYRYFAVPRSVYHELIETDSAGHFFGENVRDVYPTQHVD